MTITRSRRAGALAALATAALLAAGCGSSTGGPTSAGSSAASEASAGSVSITDAQGRMVQVPANPKTVVATDWSVIRTLTDLGVEVDAVPKASSALPADLASYEKATQVGTLFEPDYEAIAAMNPDLVIVGSRSGTPEVVKELEKFAPAVIDMSVRSKKPADTFTLTSERVTQLGSIFGKEQRAKDLMDSVASDVATVKKSASGSGKTAMVVQVSDGTVSAYGPGSRFGTVYQDFGYKPTGAPLDDKGGHGEEISQEFFVQHNPGVLFVLDRAKVVGQKQAPALDVLNNGLVGTTDAAKSKKIVEIDGFSWYVATSAPSSWQQMVKDVQGSL
ncbi:ABC transporter substrate-binding protein [Arsenicicoccus piscis]|uniref:Iron ABC transporter substrate-binding protein n=1 Tax=Arsenicicoccus piscis TaxID=673954 RepID=A0ABQ6HS83_9MICO|nr:ABC transporter substrate-binding protein [Arsenicicoccus piscis]MCH8626677.1 ABC transporter substrate-binding protein [Arsenicicoccus piscis]GMA21343.1 iron ABC transporter substrate-binding protein [Arsenicicoccus piscis]